MNWIQWARTLQAISQTGLHFTNDIYDRERYEQIGRVSAEMFAEHTNVTVDEFLEMNKSEFGYATPKVDVRGIVFRYSKILLVKEIADGGRWTLPGGWADVNETPSQAVEREVYEESGFRTRAKKLIAVYDREKQGHVPSFPYHIYKLFFLCEITGGKANSNHEASDAAFFGIDDIPELSESRVKKNQIEKFFTHLREPNLPTEFD